MLEKYYPYGYAPSVFAIDYKKLYEKGFRGLVFDIDNTLVHHGDDSTPEVDALFAELKNIGFRTLLLSNNDEERVSRFMKNIEAPYICNASKPEPEAYLKAVEMPGLNKSEVIYLGDQMFVDTVGANRCGLPNILVHFIRLPNEKKIGKKRYIEMLILWFYRRNKKYRDRLGDILKGDSEK